MDFKTTLLKLVSAFIILIVYIKISGRSQLAPLNASDQVGNMVIGALVGSTIINNDVEVWAAVVVVVAWASLQLIVRFLKFKSNSFAQIIDGKRIQLISKGNFIPENFTGARLSVYDFEANLHQLGINSVQEVYNAWLEPSGQITVDLRGDDKLSIVLISNGSINNEALKQINKDEEWLLKELENNGVEDVTEVFCAEWYNNKFWMVRS